NIAPSRVINKTIRANLETYAEQARISKELATLKVDLPLEFDWDKAAVTPPDAPRLIKLFTALGFRRFVEALKTASPNAVSPAAETSESASTGPVAATSKVERKWHTIDTTDRFDALLAELKKQRRFCVDLETTDLDPNRAEIVGWALCWESGNAA